MDLRLDKINEDISLYQYKNGFSYGTDAVLLAAYTSPKRGSRGAEIGTGTGIVSVLQAYRRDISHIWAFEIQEEYALLAQKNISLCGFEEKITVISDNVLNYKKYNLPALDYVFSNPPYMKKTSGFLNEEQRKLVARHEISADISQICLSAGGLLKNGGDFYVIYRTDRMCDLMCAMRLANIEPKNITFIESKPGEAPSLFLCRGQKDRNSSLKISRPLVMYNYDGSQSAQLDDIYETGDMKIGK